MSSGFFESFDNGVGALNNTWGHVDTSVRGQVTLTGDSGAMEPASGNAAGHGYGIYSITAALHGDAQGPAVLLWPGNNVWPGPEMDLAEINNGTAYGTLHFNAGGSDGYGYFTYDGIDESKVHTYSLDWEPGKVTFSVDGHVYGSFNDHVGVDFDHGGTNEVFSLMNQNRGHDTSLTVYEVSYSPSGGGGGGGGSAAVQAEATTSGSSAAVQAEVTTTGSSVADVTDTAQAAAATTAVDTNPYADLPGWMWPAEMRWWDFA